jgi:hypothetical protein
MKNAECGIKNGEINEELKSELRMKNGEKELRIKN